MDRFESILDESISALQAGVPVEDILSEVPDLAGELRPLLYAATILADPNPALVPDEKKAALRAEYLAQAGKLPTISPTFTEKTQAVVRIVKRRLTRKAVLSDLITITLTMILTLVMIAAILTYAASDTIPGDFLYGIKRASENIQLSFIFDQAGQKTLADLFNQTRLAEIERLIEQDRAAVVQFRGILETKGETLWIIEGITILLPTDVTVQGNPQEGDQVEIVGLLRTNHVLVADTLRKVN